MSASRTFEYDLARTQAKAVERGYSHEAVVRFVERYPEHCQFRDADGKPLGVIQRLRRALEFARQGLCKERPARRGLAQAPGDTFPMGRRIFDVELPADEYSAQPYMIRILTSPEVDCIITVLPLEFRSDIHAKKKHRELRRFVDEDITDPETPVEKVVLPPPVAVRSNLGDALSKAMRK